MGTHPEVTPADGSAPRVAHVDGNALAGLLAELSDLDVTTAIVECRVCRTSAPLAGTVVEMDDAGTIVICRSCTHTLFSMVRGADGMRVEMGSLVSVRVG